MKKYKIKSVPTKHGAFIRRRIDKSRFRAEVVGMTYLFTIIVLCLDFVGFCRDRGAKRSCLGDWYRLHDS